MPDITNDSKRSATASRALAVFARNQAMIDRAVGPTFRDPMENLRKTMAYSVVSRTNPLIDSAVKPTAARRTELLRLGSARSTMLGAFVKPQARGPALAGLVTVGGKSALASITSPRGRLLESFARQHKFVPGIAALTKARTGGLAAQLAGPKVPPGIAALTKAQTGGLAAQLAKQNSVTSAIEGMRRASDGYAATTRALEPSRRPGYALTEAIKAFDAESNAMEIYDREAIRPLPAVRNYTADLVRLQREAAEQRERERREEVDDRRQSLAVQVAMRDALIVSEEARAADAEASAKREMAALDRATAAEARAGASDGREATMLRLTVVSVAIGGVSLLVAIAAVIVTIIIAS